MASLYLGSYDNKQLSLWLDYIAGSNLITGVRAEGNLARFLTIDISFNGQRIYSTTRLNTLGRGGQTLVDLSGKGLILKTLRRERRNYLSPPDGFRLVYNWERR